MQRTLFIAATMLVIAVCAPAGAQTKTIVVTPEQVKWAETKELPAGWQVAVLAGDPTKRGTYVERVKIPPNAVIPPHWHPDTENITVLSGTLNIGQGKIADKSKGQALPAGSFYRLPAATAHFAWTDADGAVIQIHGVGPTAIRMIKTTASAD